MSDKIVKILEIRRSIHNVNELVFVLKCTTTSDKGETIPYVRTITLTDVLAYYNLDEFLQKLIEHKNQLKEALDITNNAISLIKLAIKRMKKKTKK